MSSNNPGNPEGVVNSKSKKGKWQKLDWNSDPNTYLAPAPQAPTSQFPNSTPYNNGQRYQGAGRRNNFPDNGLQSLNKAMENASLAIRKQSGPPTKFTLFPKLPTEMRLKIWNIFYESTDPRILEVELNKAKAAEYDTPGSHAFVRIAANAMKAPVAFHICHESREEAQKVWKAVDFTNRNHNQETPRLTYFNPKVDIIYFGVGNCIKTLVQFLATQHHRGQEIPNLAIICSGQLFSCCDFWDEDEIMHGPDQYACDLGHSMAGGCTLMQALHGRPKDLSWSNLSTGCKGLKKVSFIIPSKLIAMDKGDIHEGMGMRPAVGDGLTTGQVKWKHTWEQEINRVKWGMGVKDVGENKWVGEDVPEFNFMSFSLIPEAGKVYDAMKLPAKEQGKINYKNKEIIRIAERYSNCQITLAERDYAQQKEIEMGFYGKEKDIEYAKQKVIDKLKEVEKTKPKKNTGTVRRNHQNGEYRNFRGGERGN